MNIKLEKKIFLIEDSPDDELLTLRALKRNNIKNEVIVARDGQEALDWLFCEGSHANRDPRITAAVILLDLKLPKIDGIAVLRRIRSDSKTKMIPVVILTSSRQEEDILESYQIGANSYVRKPVDFLEFSEAVSRLGIYWLLVNEMPPEWRQSAEEKVA